ncbi:hypothetical protein H6F55_25235 [Phormidium sp. FACHB-322]|nr:hypothetical protein [Phormidium sp. FACHB-77]MBD2033293.1 hypothetical protein [Phormidium sp. FACHB-322]MBD2053774.1 hypothetical protein [Leptolyngbya sp. FACHB-60]
MSEATGTESFVPCIPGKTSDGYHTFDELYEHRHMLFLALLKSFDSSRPYGITSAWKSRKHDDGSSYEGWFICGIATFGNSITYHLPDRLWDLCRADELESAPPFDGHTSDDVLKRMRHWLAF